MKTRNSYIFICFLLFMFRFAVGQTQVEEYLLELESEVAVLEEANLAKVKDTSEFSLQNIMYGYRLVEIHSSPCNSDLMNKPIKERIVGLEYKRGALIIAVAISANCCSSFIGDIQLKGDSVLNLLFEEYGETQCLCHCAFRLTYHITMDKLSPKSFELNGKAIVETDQVLKIMVYEREFHSNGNLKKLVYKLDDEIVTITYYDKSGVRCQTDRYEMGKVVETIKE